MIRTALLPRWVASAGAALLLACSILPAQADPVGLRERYDALRGELRDNWYGRQLHIDSVESQKALQGDIYAVVDHPFERVRAALAEPEAWCDIMLLPFNTKYCRPVGEAGERLHVRIGRKYDQPVEQAYKLDFQFRNLAARKDYLETRLSAGEGPFGTSNYRIRVEAIPLDGDRTFLHLRYSYDVGGLGRFAMQAYLSTAGADKVGFSIAGRDAAGQPQYTGGVRGAVERNAMRYYLAIDAYLDALDVAPGQQVERRIQNWFAATERYPRQLREMDRSTYVSMKRQEYERQQSVALQ